MASGSNMRVGDAEREAVAAQLREHYADGRLTLDELNERLDLAFAAKTRADLTAVTRDLPMTARPFAGPSAGMSAGLNPWQDATSGSGSGGYGGPRRPFSMLAPVMALVWLFVILGSLFAFGFGGDRPLAIIFFLAALAFVRRLLGFRRRRGGRGGGPRGRRRCGRR